MSIAECYRVTMAGLMLFATAANAQAAQRNAADAALVDRVKDAVIKELRESGAIDRAVDAGIGRYVERQRAEAEQRERRVAEDLQDATASGGRGTPWSIIVSKSGKTYPLSGAQPYATVKQLIELALQEK